MKKLLLLLCLACLLWGCSADIQPTQTTAVQPETTVSTEPTQTETIPETTAATVPETTATVPTTSETFAPSTPQEVVGEPTYIANTNTKKFHFPDCSSVADIYEENKQPFYGSRDQLLEAGFDPCGRCHP
jgi:hypothetical protein